MDVRVLTTPPGPDSDFVEAENPEGRSIARRRRRATGSVLRVYRPPRPRRGPAYARRGPRRCEVFNGSRPRLTRAPRPPARAEAPPGLRNPALRSGVPGRCGTPSDSWLRRPRCRGPSDPRDLRRGRRRAAKPTTPATRSSCAYPADSRLPTHPRGCLGIVVRRAWPKTAALVGGSSERPCSTARADTQLTHPGALCKSGPWPGCRRWLPI